MQDHPVVQAHISNPSVFLFRVGDPFTIPFPETIAPKKDINNKRGGVSRRINECSKYRSPCAAAEDPRTSSRSGRLLYTSQHAPRGCPLCMGVSRPSGPTNQPTIQPIKITSTDSWVFSPTNETGNHGHSDQSKGQKGNVAVQGRSCPKWRGGGNRGVHERR